MSREGTDPKIRAVQALELRMAGATYRKIATQLGYPNPGNAYRAVARLLTEHARESAEQVRAMELARLDRLLLAVWGKAAAGDVAAVDRALRVMERRARIMGIDAPQKIDISGWIREMAQREGLDADEAVAIAEEIVRGAAW